MPPSAPIVITLYGPNDEVLGSYSRTRVPTQLLLQAMELGEQLEGIELEGAQSGAKEARTAFEALGAFVVEVFDHAFTLDVLLKSTEPSEMMTVLTAVVSKAKGIAEENPTQRPPRPRHPKRT